MRILVVCGNARLALNDLITNAAVDSIASVRQSTATVYFKDGCEVQCAAIHNAQDCNRFQGQRFDLLLEHDTFNARQELQLLRAMILR